MPLFLPILVAAASLWAIACSNEEKPKRPGPEDLIIGPEPLPPPTRPEPPREARLGGGAQEIIQSFRGRLEEKGAFRGLSAAEQRRFDESFQANSLHGFFSSMLVLGKDFEKAGRADPALKIFEALSSPQFPVPFELSNEAQGHAASLKVAAPAPSRRP